MNGTTRYLHGCCDLRSRDASSGAFPKRKAWLGVSNCQVSQVIELAGRGTGHVEYAAGIHVPRKYQATPVCAFTLQLEQAT